MRTSTFRARVVANRSNRNRNRAVSEMVVNLPRFIFDNTSALV